MKHLIRNIKYNRISKEVLSLLDALNSTEYHTPLRIDETLIYSRDNLSLLFHIIGDKIYGAPVSINRYLTTKYLINDEEYSIVYILQCMNQAVSLSIYADYKIKFT